MLADDCDTDKDAKVKDCVPLPNTTERNMSSPPAAKRARLEAETTTDVLPSLSSVEDLKIRYPCLADPLTAPAITEQDCGMTQYVDPTVPSLTAIIKHRFTDFLVYEVDIHGKVVQLKDTKRPEVENKPEPPVKIEKGKGKASQEPDWQSEDANALRDALGSIKFEELKAFFAQGKPAKGEESKTMETDSIESKDQRTNIHKNIRQVCLNQLSTATRLLPASNDSPEKQVIDIAWMSSKSRDHWKATKPKGDQPPYIYFTLSKCNKDTHEAINALATALNMSLREINVAGTKDKRGVTAQQVSVRRGWRTREDLWRFIHNAAHSKGSARGGRGRGRGARNSGGGGGRDEGLGFRVGDFEYKEEPLRLGLLKGNRFVITLRDVVAESPETIERAVTTVQHHGFINYYGMQRFGTSAIPTHVLGLLLLREEWELAVDVLLGARQGENEMSMKARKVWSEKKDGTGALKILPRSNVAERCILESFKKQGRNDNLDYLGALRSIPKNLKMMYIHGYQSYLWNTVVSKRIELFGCKTPIVGDVVLVDRETAEDEPAVEGVDFDEGETKDDLKHNEPGTKAELIEQLKKTTKLPAVKVLTEADLPNYNIFDVLLPLPGFIVQYPQGELGKLYREMMLADGLDPDDLYRKQSEFSMAGTYRRIMHKPSNMSYKLLKYDDPNFPLAETDEDRLFQRTLPTSPADGAHTALQIDFTLGSSTYATMALREILKAETSSQHQKGLTEAMLARDGPVTDDIEMATNQETVS